MNHAKALAIVAACDMHLECCEGKLNPDWKVDKPVDFHRFRERLGMQMLKHDARDKSTQEMKSFERVPNKIKPKEDVLLPCHLHKAFSPQALECVRIVYQKQQNRPLGCAVS